MEWQTPRASKVQHILLFAFITFYYYGPDRLESIIFDITGKKIDNHCSRLIIEFFSVISC